MFVLEFLIVNSIIIPLLAIVGATRSSAAAVNEEAQRQQNEDGAAAAAGGPSTSRDNTRQTSLLDAMNDLMAQVSELRSKGAAQEDKIEELTKQLTVTQLTMTESEFLKMTPTTYGGPSYLKDKAILQTSGKMS